MEYLKPLENIFIFMGYRWNWLDLCFFYLICEIIRKQMLAQYAEKCAVKL